MHGPLAIDPRSLASALGGKARGNHVLAPGPGHSKDDRSLSIRIDQRAPDGFLVHSHAGDDWRECRDYIKERLGVPRFGDGRREAPHRPPSPQQQRLIDGAADRQNRGRALAIWAEASPPAGTPVEAYLAGRWLCLPPDVAAADALRFHPACPIAGTRLPAMVALMRCLRTDEPRAVHRTALKPDGAGKADMPDGGTPRRMLGPAGGAAVKLCADEDVTLGLGIAEGIETALTIICGGWRPVWAAGTAGAIKSFPVLAGIEALTIFADADEAGHGAARECAARWAASGREWAIIRPPGDGADWNDWRAAA